MSPHLEHGIVRYLRVDAQGRLVVTNSIAEHACSRVVMHDLWTELRDPVATLREAARLLRQDGRLEIVERRSRIELRELVRLLENNGWDIHSSTSVGEDGYLLEAAICDESVTS
jgi:hypothetical protein